jgi:hypothetical protein
MLCIISGGMNKELEEIWKEAILAFLEVLRKTTKNISEDTSVPVRI